MKAQNGWASHRHGTSLSLGHSHKFCQITGFMHSSEYILLCIAQVTLERCGWWASQHHGLDQVMDWHTPRAQLLGSQAALDEHDPRRGELDRPVRQMYFTGVWANWANNHCGQTTVAPQLSNKSGRVTTTATIYSFTRTCPFQVETSQESPETKLLHLSPGKFFGEGYQTLKDLIDIG